jgi:hypothetical protein
VIFRGWLFFLLQALDSKFLENFSNLWFIHEHCVYKSCHLGNCFCGSGFWASGAGSWTSESVKMSFSLVRFCRSFLSWFEYKLVCFFIAAKDKSEVAKGLENEVSHSKVQHIYDSVILFILSIFALILCNFYEVKRFFRKFFENDFFHGNK